ncbi:MAG: Gfo/Idh/MocA family oxidoreductase [Clostridia bacterium]|nr:Gfo/Idh/MocA family oxidoreductase [Clostridia bacterium]
MRKIGFVDYYLSEWHANQYPAWIKAANELLGTDFAVSYAWAEQEISPVDGKSTAEWCEKYGAAACDSLEALCEKSDAILILAPSDPEKHLPYAETVLRYGKPTYIDKTFAPDAATAERIFALAEQHSTPLFSSSALRYASELALPFDCRCVATTGSGSSLAEYIVHQAEMVVKCLGVGAKALQVTDRLGTAVSLRITYGDDRAASMTFAPGGLPFTVYAEDADGKAVWHAIKSDFFQAMLCDILRFFTSKQAPVPPRETVEVMRLREAALKAVCAPGETVFMG